jgi:hypothetical protein
MCSCSPPCTHHTTLTPPPPLPLPPLPVYAPQAIPIRDLPLRFDADKLHLAFALWAEGLASCIPCKSGGGGDGGGGKKQKAATAGGGSGVGGSKAAGGAREAARPAKKAKK